jgi:hypothetical protein
MWWSFKYDTFSHLMYHGQDHSLLIRQDGGTFWYTVDMKLDIVYFLHEICLIYRMSRWVGGIWWEMLLLLADNGDLDGSLGIRYHTISKPRYQISQLASLGVRYTRQLTRCKSNSKPRYQTLAGDVWTEMLLWPMPFQVHRLIGGRKGNPNFQNQTQYLTLSP